ncbi:unnamed protein product [Ixodes pacificus]
MPRLRLEIPKYTGYADTKSVADFLLELHDYQEASGISEVALLARVLPVALTGKAADWRRRQQSFLTSTTLQNASEASFYHQITLNVFGTNFGHGPNTGMNL